ncbi:Pycsar system effector family protein [Cecembia sp.]|uniref:Pycsar system effector family protein n=1 Tax=Cecembia sp. TaxID=1898110 RepID=UPI0025B92DBB|nr:Pycsar system effector family protein [Cecembia sp.]
MQEEKSNKKEKSERERQTFFRVAFKNNCNLLQIADNKANMVISINALVISSIIAISSYGTISNKFEMYSFKLIIPLVLILVACLISTILGVQAAKPKILDDNKKGGQSQTGSILFFGESSAYTKEEYLNELEKILPSRNALNSNMSVTLYYQGRILKNKYNLLGYAYNVFLLGLAIGVFSFLIFLFFDLN